MMKSLKQQSALLRKIFGCLLILVGIFAAYWWFYKLAPVRHLGDPQWRAAHSPQACWEEEQEKYNRLSASPDLCFAGDMIGYYGDKHWCLWLIGKMNGGGNFRVCGCSETALMFMANREEPSWKDWADAHRDETQEEWIRDGFTQRGVMAHLPPQPEDTVPLLEVLGHKSWNTLWGGPQGTNAPQAIPNYFQYNAFRWLRDSGFDQTAFAVSPGTAFTSDVVRIGLMQYTKWNTAFPKYEGVGILTFGKKPDGDDDSGDTPSIFWSWSQVKAWFLIMAPMAAGCMVLCWRRKGVGDRVKRGASFVTIPFRAAGRWVWKHRRKVLSAGLLAGCLCIAVAYVMLPRWLPEWVISHSTSPERVLSASYYAFNGHFEATPVLKKILGDEFDDFLVEKLSGSDDAAKDEAACILAYSHDPAGEQALINAYLQGQSEDMKRRLLFFLGWTATDRSREFLKDILDGRIEGPRWSAVRSLSWSTIPDRYEIISKYLNDPDEDVREQAADALKDRQEHIGK